MNYQVNARIIANPLAAGLAAGEATTDRIAWVRTSLVFLPLAQAISDAKVLTGRQKPLTEIAFLFAEIETENGHSGIGYSYSKRAGGPGQFAHAKEIAGDLIGEDPNDIARLWDKLVLGRRLGRPQRHVHAGHRRLRHRAVGSQGQARQAAAGKAARCPS